jgi:small subunit ribosomal protein S4e
MGKKGKTGRLKRKPAPRFWPIHRKEYAWAVKPSSGPHATEQCLPLSLVLRDILKMAKTRKEAKIIVAQGKVYVDGKARKQDDFPLGLMDVLSFPELDRHYRVIPSHKGLVLAPISKDEASFKLARVEDKRLLKNGRAQLNLHDGSNLSIRASEQESPQAQYETFEVLKLSLPEKQVLGRIKVKEGNCAVITGGQNIGIHGKIVEIEKAEAKRRRNALVIIKDEKGAHYQTILDFVFTIGEAAPLVSVSEATVNV